VIVTFSRRRPSAAEVVAIRRHYPPMRDVSIPEVRRMLEWAAKDNWTCRLEFHMEDEARAAVAGLRAAGVTARIK
jgi:hypothetical protein